MTVDPARAAGTVDHNGITYYFCSKGLHRQVHRRPAEVSRRHARADGRRGRHAHDRRPEEVVGRQSSVFSHESSVVSPGRQPNCRMGVSDDPEVVSDRPGPCPKCGMALEPRVADPTDAPNPSSVDMSRRFRIGVLLGRAGVSVDDGATC